MELDHESSVGRQPLFEKLKPGPGVAPEEVFADQQRRLHGAMIALVDRSGYRSVRVRHLARTAGVSTATFYKHFDNVEACLVSTYDAQTSVALERIANAQRGQHDWRGALRATTETLLAHLAEDPRATRLTMLEVFGAGPAARKRVGMTIGALERRIAESFTAAPKTLTPPRHLIAGMTAGVLRVARRTTEAGRAADLPALADELAAWMSTLPDPEVLSLAMGRSEVDAASGGDGQLESLFAETRSESGPTIRGDRERLLRAAIRLTAADGLSALTPRRLQDEATVSRRAFEAWFASPEECFLDAIGLIVREAAGRARFTAASQDGWERCACGFVLSLCAQAARDRPLSALAFLGTAAVGLEGLRWRDRLIDRTAALLRTTVPADLRPSSVAAEASVAAAWHIVQAEIAARRTRGLPRVAPLLNYVILAPIIGARTASTADRQASVLPSR